MWDEDYKIETNGVEEQLTHDHPDICTYEHFEIGE